MYNPSHCLKTDVLKTNMIISGNSVTPCIVLREEIRNMLASNSEAFVKLILHSQGAAVGFNALSNLSKKERQRISVLAVAPAKIVPDALVFRSKNIANRLDITPYLYNSRSLREQEQHLDYAKSI